MATITGGRSVVATAVSLPAGQSAGTPIEAIGAGLGGRRSRAPINSAVMKAIGNNKPIDIPGTRELKIDQPVAGTIEADEYLPEPFVIDPPTIQSREALQPCRPQWRRATVVPVRRRCDDGPPLSESRVERSDTPIATTDEGARSVVRNIAPIMAAADASTVNLETVVGQLPTTGAYPAKRFLLQSPPVVLAALHDMGVDLVTLGNNHAYDWQGPGVASTIAALDGAGIAWAGAGTTAEQARPGG